MTTQTTASASFRNAHRAFTLLEILVVLAIIGMLVGLAVGNLDKIFGNAKITTAKTFVTSSLKLPLASYKLAMNDYPSTAEGLLALAQAPAGNPNVASWSGPYIETAALNDPWGRPYQYAYPSTHTATAGTAADGSATVIVAKPYDIWSFGPDMIDGTADDIGNWMQ
ncbi:MAG: type II secretion system major pseudopilin GspG [Verrucomicrobiota bacterium]